MAMVLVAVVPQFGLVEQEKEHQAASSVANSFLRAGLAFEGLGQQVHEAGGQQRAGGQAQHVLGVALASTPKLNMAATHTLPIPATRVPIKRGWFFKPRRGS
jgi:hypothetical protein